jgi:hypothetical protein
MSGDTNVIGHVLETIQTYRAASDTVNPLRSQDFHVISTTREAPIRTRTRVQQLLAGELFTAHSTTLFRPRANKTSTRPTEDGYKLKDRLEVLLCAETLQGTLSPNANPEQPGLIGGFPD